MLNMMRVFPEPHRADLASISSQAHERTQLRSLEHRKLLRAIVWDFALAHGRVVYGGAALSAVINMGGGVKDADSHADPEDIEFYSPEPGKDVVQLCDLLKTTHGMEYVQGREAVHVGTLTVSVEFRRCCDITFMPRRTLAAMPTLLVDGVRCIHPHVMAMDLLRMLTEPDTSYWRLEKAYAGMRVLEEHYPLCWNVPTTAGCPDSALHCPTLPELLCGSAVVVGSHAASFFEMQGETADSSFQLVCVRYDHDVEVARHLFAGRGMKEVQLDAFVDLLGRSTRFLDGLDGHCVAELIDAHPRCVPCSPALGATVVASSLFCLVTAMACHLRAFVTGDAATLVQQGLICTRLLAARRGQLGCEDFGLDLIIGATETDMLLHMRSKIKAGRPKSWMHYTPSTSADGGSSQRQRMLQAMFPSKTGRVSLILNGTTMSAQQNTTHRHET